MSKLQNEAHRLLKSGVYDPTVLFDILYRKFDVHYSQVREAVHAAKQR